MSRLFQKTPPNQLEAARQQRVIKYLRLRNWQVKETEGTLLSYGWPDLYTAHLQYGPRWIEMKVPGGKLRETQIEFITDFALVGVGVWVLTDDTIKEYQKLFKPPNWQEFL